MAAWTTWPAGKEASPQSLKPADVAQRDVGEEAGTWTALWHSYTLLAALLRSPCGRILPVTVHSWPAGQPRIPRTQEHLPFPRGPPTNGAAAINEGTMERKTRRKSPRQGGSLGSNQSRSRAPSFRSPDGEFLHQYLSLCDLTAPPPHH